MRQEFGIIRLVSVLTPMERPALSEYALEGVEGDNSGTLANFSSFFSDSSRGRFTL